jgi:hypothetical protein
VGLGLVAAAFGLGASGCFVQQGQPTDGAIPLGGTLDSNPMTVGIDSGAKMTSPPGQGAGLFVEYTDGGHWHVFTTCDTSISQTECTFDAFLSVNRAGTVSRTDTTGSGIVNVRQQFTPGDPVTFVEYQSAGTVHLHAVSDFDAPGITFDTADGATLSLVMYLDGQPQPAYVYWVGDGLRHAGAPTDPVDFQPVAVSAGP